MKLSEGQRQKPLKKSYDLELKSRKAGDTAKASARLKGKAA